MREILETAHGRRLYRTHTAAGAFDWEPEPGTSTVEVWESSALFDALGRPYTSISATEDDSTRTPSATHYGYDLGGYLVTIDVELRGATPASGYVTDIQYNARGQRTSIAYGSGVTTTYTYDADTFRLTRLLSEKGATVLQDLKYTYGPAGQIFAVEDAAQDTVFFSNTVARPIQRYVYDARNRLVKAVGRELKVSPYGLDQEALQTPQTAIPSSTTDIVEYEREYEWDAAGNMTTLSHSQNTGSPVNWTRTMAYATDSNRLTSVTHGSAPAENITYDQHGQMEGLPFVREMLWDPTGNLRYSKNQSGSDFRTWYVYAGAQRVRKITEKWNGTSSAWYRYKETYYLGDFELYRTYTAAGALDYERESLQVTDGDSRVVEAQTETVATSPSSLLRYSLSNPTMSVTVQTDGSGNVIWYEEFRPFGSSAYVASDGALSGGANRYRYQGKERDLETGLDYYGYRYLCSWLGRWTCPDPGGTVDGLNLYGFVGGDPVGKRDGDGREDVGLPAGNVGDEFYEAFHRAGAAVSAATSRPSTVFEAADELLDAEDLGFALRDLLSSTFERDTYNPEWIPRAAAEVVDSLRMRTEIELGDWDAAFDSLIAGNPEPLLELEGVPSVDGFMRCLLEAEPGRYTADEWGKLLAVGALIDLTMGVEVLTNVENRMLSIESQLSTLDIVARSKARLIEYRERLGADPDDVVGTLELLTSADHFLEAAENALHPFGSAAVSRQMTIGYEFGKAFVPGFRWGPTWFEGAERMTARDTDVTRASFLGVDWAVENFPVQTQGPAFFPIFGARARALRQ